MADTTTTTTTEAGLTAWATESSSKYSKLAGKAEYDHEAAEQLAAALNEIAELELKVNQLKQLVNENEELHKFVWRSEAGVLPLHNIGNDHLGNIMLHMLRRGRAIPREIRGEAMHRGVTIPNKVPIDWSDEATYLDRSDI